MAKRTTEMTPSTDGKAADTVEELSVQRRTLPRNLPESMANVFWFVGSGEGDVADWWSEERDRNLRDFWMQEGNDILQGAVSSMVKKFKAMSWVIEGPERVINKFQPVLAEAEFGMGWGHLLGRLLTDYLTQDKGAFVELIGRGDTDKAIDGPVMGLSHLDAGLCQLTGDPTYPVLYLNPKKDKSHKLHTTRVVHLVDMPSPKEGMNNIGFCAVSRVLASSNVLLKLARYKNEKLSDLPQAGLLILNNIMPHAWDDVKAEYERERRRLGQQLWANVMALFGLDPAQPASAEFLSFSNLPDAFDELQATNIYVNIVALAFGVDVREFWPLSAGPLGTAAETLIQHQKARGKGVGDIISTLERAINWKVLPASATFHFDFHDDEEDVQRAEVNKTRIESIMEMWQPPKPDDPEPAVVTRGEIRQMLADNVEYFKDDFLVVDVTEEEEVSDTERDKALLGQFGPWVCIDRKGKVYRPRKPQKLAAQVDMALALAEENYKAGSVAAEDLAEYLLGVLVERRVD